ncbi:MAG: redox-sensing transcriptional repressor Rex [Actinomycetota bacterium]|nr:redox-sensing transcriptional repressor Rex [Actinomycetota bacterium]
MATNREVARNRRSRTPIPEATVARLTLYERTLVDLAEAGVATVSSRELAELAGVNAAKVRKDISHLGSYGTRGVGYEVDGLLREISVVLGGEVPTPVVIVGAGNLGRALSRYDGFQSGGFPIVGLVDADPSVVGRNIGGVEVSHIDDLNKLIVEKGCVVGIIATPAQAAQEVADRLVAAGVQSILNFAPALIEAQPGVEVRKVDLATELQILAYHEHRRSSGGVRSQRAVG